VNEAKFAAPLANDFDQAGIPNWQYRLREARARDHQEYVKGVVRNISHFDRCWYDLKDELKKKLGEAQ
jgi:hypothetical protein